MARFPKVYFAKMCNTPSDVPKLQEGTVNEVMEAITLRYVSHRTEPLDEAANEEDLSDFFNQYSNLMSANSD